VLQPSLPNQGDAQRADEGLSNEPRVRVVAHREQWKNDLAREIASEVQGGGQESAYLLLVHIHASVD
jgi:hypothetical protein